MIVCCMSLIYVVLSVLCDGVYLFVCLWHGLYLLLVYRCRWCVLCAVLLFYCTVFVFGVSVLFVVCCGAVWCFIGVSCAYGVWLLCCFRCCFVVMV